MTSYTPHRYRDGYISQPQLRLRLLPTDDSRYIQDVRRLAESILTRGDPDPVTTLRLKTMGYSIPRMKHALAILSTNPKDIQAIRILHDFESAQSLIRRMEFTLGLVETGRLDQLVENFLRSPNTYSSKCLQYQDAGYCFNQAIIRGDLKMLHHLLKVENSMPFPMSFSTTNLQALDTSTDEDLSLDEEPMSIHLDDIQMGLRIAIEYGPNLTDTFEFLWSCLTPEEVDEEFINEMIDLAIREHRREILRLLVEFASRHLPAEYPTILNHTIREIARIGRDKMVLDLQSFLLKSESAVVICRLGMIEAQIHTHPEVSRRLERILDLIRLNSK